MKKSGLSFEDEIGLGAIVTAVDGMSETSRRLSPEEQQREVGITFEETSVVEAKTSLVDAGTSVIDAETSLIDAKTSLVEAGRALSDALAQSGWNEQQVRSEIVAFGQRSEKGIAIERFRKALDEAEAAARSVAALSTAVFCPACGGELTGDARIDTAKGTTETDCNHCGAEATIKLHIPNMHPAANAADDDPTVMAGVNHIRDALREMKEGGERAAGGPGLFAPLVKLGERGLSPAARLGYEPCPSCGGRKQRSANSRAMHGPIRCRHPFHDPRPETRPAIVPPSPPQPPPKRRRWTTLRELGELLREAWRVRAYNRRRR